MYNQIIINDEHDISTMTSDSTPHLETAANDRVPTQRTSDTMLKR